LDLGGQVAATSQVLVDGIAPSEDHAGQLHGLAHFQRTDLFLGQWSG
jgi:hypothetical protein